MSKRLLPFLALFDGGAQATSGQQPADPPAVAPSAPVTTPATAPQTTAPAVDPVKAAEDNLRAAREAHAKIAAVQASAAPVATPAVMPAQSVERDALMLQRLEELNAKLEASEKRREAAELDAYRQYAIGQVRASGRELLDGYVVGNSRSEIDASIQVAIAEYDLVASRVRSQLVNAIPQPPVAPPPAAPVVAAPVGVSTQTTAAAIPAAPQPPPVSGPTAVSVPGAAPQTGYTQEQIQYLTSPAAMQNGDYARHRHNLMAQLRGQMIAPPQQWAFTPSYQVGPGFPPGMQTGPAQMPVVQHAGVTIPQPVAAAPTMGPAATYAAVPTATYPQGVPQPGPANLGRAPQPFDLQHDLGGGQYAPIPGATFDANAARAAANAAVAAKRGSYTSQPTIHDAGRSN